MLDPEMFTDHGICLAIIFNLSIDNDDTKSSKCHVTLLTLIFLLQPFFVPVKSPLQTFSYKKTLLMWPSR